MAEFSGKNSHELWDLIRKTGNRKKRKKAAEAVHEALYLMGVKCQNLESEVETLKKLYLKDKMKEVDDLLDDVVKIATTVAAKGERDGCVAAGAEGGVPGEGEGETRTGE